MAGEKIDDIKFGLRLNPGGYPNEHYDDGKFNSWPTWIMVILDGKPLSVKTFDGKSFPYQRPGYLWNPGHMLGNGALILEGKPDTFSLHNMLTELSFDPVEEEQVRISLTKNGIPLEKIAFNPSSINDVIVNRDEAALEFFMCFNDIVRDVSSYRDAETGSYLREDYEEVFCLPPIKTLFEKYGVKIAELYY